MTERQAVCLRWHPIRRANPRSTLVGYVDILLASGLILRGLSVCASDGRQWVVPPARLRVDVSNVPVGTGDDARWDQVVEFENATVRTRFMRTVIDALRRDHPNAFAARPPPLVDDPLPF